MPRKTSDWSQARDKALDCLPVSEELFLKELEPLEAFARSEGHDLDSLEECFMKPDVPMPEGEEAEKLVALRKDLKTGRHNRGGLDPLMAPNGSKIQVTVQDGTRDLLIDWAAAESRDLSTVTNLAIEAGLRALRADGAIPQAAIEAHEFQCKQRIAAAQARALVDNFLDDVINPF